jgi:hypothetical protein
MDREVKCIIKEKKVEKQKTDMEGHPAHSPNIVIPRTFRWTLTNESHSDIRWWMKSIKTDYVGKKITVEVYDDAKGAIFTWIQALVDEEKTATNAALTHFDGMGNAISVLNFTGLKIEDHMTSYDYGSSEVLTHKLVITYTKVKRTNELNIN